MSYLLKICRENSQKKELEVVELPGGHAIFGPNIKLGSPETRAQLSVTVNYSEIYVMLPALGGAVCGTYKPGINVLNGVPLEWAIKTLSNAICNINVIWPGCFYDPDADYWEPTPGNAKHALENFLEICHRVVAAYPEEWNRYDKNANFKGFVVKVEY